MIDLKVVGLQIKEETSKNGNKYQALVLVTDDKDYPEKVIGFINKTSVKCIPITEKK